VEKDLIDRLESVAERAPATFGGFATTLTGLAKFLAAGAALARAQANELPAKEIGLDQAYDYTRQEPGRFVRLGERPAATCDNTVVLKWERDVRMPGPANCTRLTGQEVQSALDAERQAAEAAAARICSDPACKYSHTTLTYQKWECGVIVGADDQAEMYLRITLQLELECRMYD
jgi:hypothetical protein